MVVTCCKLAASAADLGAEEEREKWALEGLSYEDFISFPYGDGAKTGTRTKETDEMEGLG